MHGPVLPWANKKWMKMGNAYLKDMMTEFDFHRGHVVSLQDDAPKPLRNYRTKLLRSFVQKATANKRRALILPLLLSHGGIEAGILERLKGLDYTWLGETLLPDDRLNRFLKQRIESESKSAAL